MLDIKLDRPPPDVIDAANAAGWHADGSSWSRLSGGRTNRLWKFRANGRVLVGKLFASDAATPMFPNDAKAEALALKALGGTSLAPKLGAMLTCPSGDFLIYEFVESTGTPSLVDAANVLAKLHRQPLPKGFKARPGVPSILQQADTMLHGISDRAVQELKPYRPVLPDLPPLPPVFLHGDPVPANIIATRTGPCLIDWQCPGIGDPTEDLSVFLSPAMRHLYKACPLEPAQITAFLAAYGNADRAAQYDALAQAYHYRMAAYCLWKAHAGDRDYAAAAELELSCLKQIN